MLLPHYGTFDRTLLLQPKMNRSVNLPLYHRLGSDSVNLRNFGDGQLKQRIRSSSAVRGRFYRETKPSSAHSSTSGPPPPQRDVFAIRVKHCDFNSDVVGPLHLRQVRGAMVRLGERAWARSGTSLTQIGTGDRAALL